MNSAVRPFVVVEPRLVCATFSEEVTRIRQAKQLPKLRQPKPYGRVPVGVRAITSPMAVTRTRSEKLIGLLSRNAASEKFLQNLQGKHGYRFLSRLLTRDDVLFLN